MDTVNRLEVNPSEAFTIAGELFRSGQFAEAESIFRVLHKLDTKNFHLAQAIGVCLIEQSKSAEALPWLDEAGLRIRDELVTCGANRGKALAELGRCDEALVQLNQVLLATPNHVETLFNRGLVHLQMGKHEVAIEHMNKVLGLQPDNAKAKFARGFANLVLGNYLEGFRDYECRLKDQIEEPKAELWTGEQNLYNKSILVHGEQGLGDNIMFARYLEPMIARGATVYVWVPKSVRPLLQHLPITFLPDVREEWPKTDFWVRFMSLAYCFKTERASIPAPVKLACKWIPIARTRRPRIGLCWSGSRQSRYDQWRSIPLAKLKPLFDLPVDFVSLQLDVRDEDRTTFEQLPFDKPLLPDFRASAEVMADLDAVITVDTSVAHLAGTVGVPTFIMLTAFRTYWLWIADIDWSPWYPSVKLFRQPRDGNWSPVVDAVRKAIA